MFFSELHVGNLCPDLLFFLVSFAVLSSTDVKRTTCEEGYKKASIYLLQPPRFLLTAMASLGKYIMSSNYNYTRDRNVCQGWPFYGVKCFCSKGREWGKQGDHYVPLAFQYLILMHTVQNRRVILDKLPSTFDTWFGVYILWIFINNN